MYKACVSIGLRRVEYCMYPRCCQIPIIWGGVEPLCIFADQSPCMHAFLLHCPRIEEFWRRATRCQRVWVSGPPFRVYLSSFWVWIETHICKMHILSLSLSPVPWMCSRDVCGNQIVPLPCFLSSVSSLCSVAWQLVMSLFLSQVGATSWDPLAFFQGSLQFAFSFSSVKSSSVHQILPFLMQTSCSSNALSLSILSVPVLFLFQVLTKRYPSSSITNPFLRK